MFSTQLILVSGSHLLPLKFQFTAQGVRSGPNILITLTKGKAPRYNGAIVGCPVTIIPDWCTT